MLTVLTPSQMAAVDAAAAEPVEVLIGRAAGAVARAAVDLMGGTYGRRVVVVAGPGHNGEDGRVAAALLARRGVRVTVHDVADAPTVLGPADLVIDAAFGTGFRGNYRFPDVDGAPVLAVDIPSGISGLTGAVSGAPAPAIRTVTFAALKPGLVLGAGPSYAGEVVVADIGLDVEDTAVVGAAGCHLVTDDDVLAWVPARAVDDHKWRHAVWVVAGSPGMTGAAQLCSTAALRAGAGYVRLTVPGVEDPPAPTEAVVLGARTDDWDRLMSSDASRFGCVAIGPGLGRDAGSAARVRAALAATDRPVVLDGDGLAAIADAPTAALHSRPVVDDVPAPTVLTPHDGEFEMLTGAPPGEDRVDAARALAATTGAVVLLKGPTTVVAEPDGDVLLVRSGDERLATAGTGDVLTGTIAALIASGASPARAAAAGAHLHGRAAELGPRRGLVASDVADALPDAWADLLG
ncbi:MAG: NAD(P)H-hydrate dehydratase [Microthrixaceae bacterium]|nr:NAD(P)H-hydrate dehydratase [Microthrixaceae bacterium]